MKLLHHILVGLDLGPRTELVVATARRLARKFGSDLYLLYVLPGSGDPSSLDADMVEMARHGAESRLREIASGLEDDGVTVSGVEVALGSTFDQIIQHADEGTGDHPLWKRDMAE